MTNLIQTPYSEPCGTGRDLSCAIHPHGHSGFTQFANISYLESVVENGVTCCHHTCGNPLLDEYVQGLLSVAGVSEEDADMYCKMMDEATKRQTDRDASGKGVGDYVEGYEMEKENTRPEDTGPMSYSGSDIMGLSNSRRAPPSHQVHAASALARTQY